MMITESDENSVSLQQTLLTFVQNYKLDLYKFKPLVWRRLGPVDKDSVPQPRSGHRMVFHDNCLYSYGGYNPETRPKMFHELWEYDIFKEKWFQKTLNGVSSTNVASFAALKINDSSNRSSPMAKLLMIGGTNHPFGISLSRQIYLFDLKSFHCEELPADDGAESDDGK